MAITVYECASFDAHEDIPRLSENVSSAHSPKKTVAGKPFFLNHGFVAKFAA